MFGKNRMWFLSQSWAEIQISNVLCAHILQTILLICKHVCAWIYGENMLSVRSIIFVLAYSSYPFLYALFLFFFISPAIVSNSGVLFCCRSNATYYNFFLFFFRCLDFPLKNELNKCYFKFSQSQSNNSSWILSSRNGKQKLWFLFAYGLVFLLFTFSFLFESQRWNRQQLRLPFRLSAYVLSQFLIDDDDNDDVDGICKQHIWNIVKIDQVNEAHQRWVE